MNNRIFEVDKDFSEATFLSKADHIFIMILDAIMDNDLSSVRHYISNDIYNRLNMLVNEYKSKNYTRLFDEMNVKSTKITDINIDNENINITVTLSSRYMDYIIDDDGNLVSGINTHRIEYQNVIVFTKKINAKELNETRSCPSCGHSLDINDSGLCPYCNQTIDMSKYDYIVTYFNLK